MMTRQARAARVWTLLFVGLWLSGVRPPSLAGASGDEAWSGTWRRTEPVPGGGPLTLKLKGADKGTLTLTGSACLREDTPAAVTIRASSIRLDIKDRGLDNRGATAVFTGTISGKKISGTMTVSCAAGTGKGTWQASKD